MQKPYRRRVKLPEGRIKLPEEIATTEPSFTGRRSFIDYEAERAAHEADYAMQRRGEMIGATVGWLVVTPFRIAWFLIQVCIMVIAFLAKYMGHILYLTLVCGAIIMLVRVYLMMF